MEDQYNFNPSASLEKSAHCLLCVCLDRMTDHLQALNKEGVTVQWSVISLFTYSDCASCKGGTIARANRTMAHPWPRCWS